MKISDISKQSSNLLEKCANDGTEKHLGGIDEFIALCKKTGESAMKSKEYGLAIECEQMMKHWHYRKSNITGENEYRISAYLFSDNAENSS